MKVSILNVAKKSFIFLIALTIISVSTVASKNISKSLDEGVTYTEADYVLKILRENRTGLTLGEEEALAEIIVSESKRKGLEPLFVLALIETESTFNNWAKSNKGALGLMQVRPRTGKYLAGELDIEWNGERTLYDPYLNVKMGVHYLSLLIDRFDDDKETALTAYNVGPTSVSSKIRRGHTLPKRYRTKVLSKYEVLKKGAE
ncbi:MAG: lytic transglycosylase domain-containing protein [Deltaproteobacteria bacterium]|nr:lytic transglycosylase domain-containing protein [Deltaproteobacteria bacterium]